MEDLTFDRMAKTLGVGSTRRATTRLLAGGALGALLLGRLGLQPARAACRGSRDQCDRDEHCCSGRCEKGFCKCKSRGKCDGDKECCSGTCRNGKCEKEQGLEGWGCPAGKFLCFRQPTNFSTCTPVSLTKVEVPQCFTYLPSDPCLPGILPKCPKTACQACNERFPQECQGQCHAARDCPNPGARNSLLC